MKYHFDVGEQLSFTPWSTHRCYTLGCAQGRTHWGRVPIGALKKHIFSGFLPLTRAPLGGGLFRAPPPPLVFLRYLLNQCRYHHQTCSTLSPNNFTHCVKILKSRVL